MGMIQNKKCKKSFYCIISTAAYMRQFCNVIMISAHVCYQLCSFLLLQGLQHRMLGDAALHYSEMLTNGNAGFTNSAQ